LRDVQEFFSGEIIRLLKVKTLAVLKGNNIDMTSNSIKALLSDFDCLSNLFNGLKSEYQQLKYFTNSRYVDHELKFVMVQSSR